MPREVLAQSSFTLESGFKFSVFTNQNKGEVFLLNDTYFQEEESDFFHSFPLVSLRKEGKKEGNKEERLVVYYNQECLRLPSNINTKLQRYRGE